MNLIIQQAAIVLVILMSSFSINGQCEENEMVTPTISIDPIQVFCEGTDVTVTTRVSWEGVSPVYQWQYGDVHITNTSSILELENVKESSLEVKVRLISSESCKVGDAEATSVLVVVPGPNPVILSPDVSICETDPITIYGQDLSGSSHANYQWYKNGEGISGENKVYLESVSTSGAYSFSVDNDICSAVLSNEALVTVTNVPEVDASTNGIDVIIAFIGEEVSLLGIHNGEVAFWVSETFSGIVDEIDLKTPLNTMGEEGTHIIRLTAINGECSAEDEVELIICGNSTPNQALSRSARSVFYVPEIKNEETELELEIYTQDGSLERKCLISQNKQLRADDLEKGLYAYLLIDPKTMEQVRTGAIQVID